MEVSIFHILPLSTVTLHNVCSIKLLTFAQLALELKKDMQLVAGPNNNCAGCLDHNI